VPPSLPPLRRHLRFAAASPPPGIHTHTQVYSFNFSSFELYFRCEHFAAKLILIMFRMFEGTASATLPPPLHPREFSSIFLFNSLYGDFSPPAPAAGFGSPPAPPMVSPPPLPTYQTTRRAKGVSDLDSADTVTFLPLQEVTLSGAVSSCAV